MSADVEKKVDVPPSPFPDPVVFAWLSFLEGLVGFGLTVFTFGLLEAGEIIPDLVNEWLLSVVVFLVIGGLTLFLRLYKAGYVGS
ncbi:MAG: hypothetical protein V5A56_04495 [Halolamina sp.]